MPNNTPTPITEDSIRVESIFIRHRNALMLRAHFPTLYTDYYLHLMQHQLRYPPNLDEMLKDTLAMLVLHATARPWAENFAWTINLRSPRVNLFVTGGSPTGTVTGRIFTENVRESDRNLFYSQTLIENQKDLRASTVEIQGQDPISWIEQYYQQSEQRPGRAFRLQDETFVLIAAQPDCDEPWLQALTSQSVQTLLEQEETKLLETRNFRFDCGCNLEKILPVLASWKQRPDELFQNNSEISIQCPRCAATYTITRNMLQQIPDLETPTP